MAAELQQCLQQQRDEITALKAIYGEEFTVHSQELWESMLNLDVIEEPVQCSVWRKVSERGEITVSFQLPKEYPNALPHTSILCDCVSGDALVELHHEVNETMEMYAQMGEPCLQQIVELVFSFISEREENESGLIQSQSVARGGDSRNGETPPHDHNTTIPGQGVLPLSSEEPACVDATVAVVHLDHMHNSKLYTKKLGKWSKECGVHCTLADCGLHCIFGIVLGEHSAVDAFLRAWRTRNVDEDVKGRPCKEKMIRVLCTEALQFASGPPESSDRCQQR